MDKIELIQYYIDRCNSVEGADRYLLKKEIFAALHEDITGISVEDPLVLIKGRLHSHLAHLKDEKLRKVREYGIKMAMFSQPKQPGGIYVHAEANPVQNQSVNVNISLQQTLELIDNIPNENLSFDDKEVLKELLFSLEIIKATNDKSKTWDKAKKILEFVADKGADAAIAVLPQVISGLQILQ